MLKHSRQEMALAICSSALAGYVDAIGFLSLGGFFVSFMSGNSTRLAVGMVDMPAEALVAAQLIASFVAGVMAGSLVARAARGARKPAVLGLVAVALAASAALAGGGQVNAAMMVAAAAMGAENAMFERDGEVAIGLTYMTGTLVKLGQRLATALTGGDRLAWIPYVMLWLGLVGGAVAGAFAFLALGFSAVWVAAGFALVLALVAQFTGQANDGAPSDLK